MKKCLIIFLLQISFLLLTSFVGEKVYAVCQFNPSECGACNTDVWHQQVCPGTDSEAPHASCEAYQECVDAPSGVSCTESCNGRITGTSGTVYDFRYQPCATPNSYCGPELGDGTHCHYCVTSINIPTSTPPPPPTPFPTNTPAPQSTPVPQSCAEKYPGTPLIGCGDCHFFAANGGSCYLDEGGCCAGRPGGPPPSTITPPPEHDCIPDSYTCSNLTAYNVTKTGVGAIPAEYARGKDIGNSPYDDTFSGSNSITVNTGDIVSFSTALGGINDPRIGYMNFGSDKRIVRTQFITRDRSIPSAGQSADVIGSCLMVHANFDTNFCLKGVSKLAWSRNNTSWPYGYWPWVVADGPPPVYRFNPPANFSSYDAQVVAAPTFSEAKVEAGISRVFSGQCNKVRKQQSCCAVRRDNPGSPPGVPEQYTCTNTEEDPDDCSTRAFFPASCQFDDFGFKDVPYELAKSRTMRKQFNTPGQYTVEATAQSCGSNNSHPCALQVVVGTPNHMIKGTLWSDDNGNASPDGGENYYTGNITMSLSPAPPGYTFTIDHAGNYTFGNVPDGSYNIIVNQASIDTNRYISSAISGMNAIVSGADANGQQVFVSRYYTISGTVYNDQDKDGVRDPGEPLYPKGTVSLNGNGITKQAPVDPVTGTYTFALTQQVKPSQNPLSYSVAYNFVSDPPYYSEPPRSYNVYPSPSNCEGLALPAKCEAISWPGVNGDITNLNFAVTNSIPWVQFQGLDVRQEGTFTMQVPETVAPVCRDSNGAGNKGYSSITKY